MPTVHLAAEAMATRFEIVLHGERETSLRAAGEEALSEIHRLEAALSVYRPGSQIAMVNREAGRSPVRVTPEVFELIRHAALIAQATDGAFDVTVGPLLRVWGLVGGTGHRPRPNELAAAREAVGIHQLELDPSTYCVRLRHPQAMLDLGSIGKGYALDCAAECLREAGITSALIHGGTSTAVAIGTPLNGARWRVAIDRPLSRTADRAGPPAAAPPEPPLTTLDLSDESLSVSAIWGKGFEEAGQFLGHVLDPRAGEPVRGALLAAVVLPTATESDALSTALLVRGAEMVERLQQAQPSTRCLVAEPDPVSPVGYRVVANGISCTVS